MIYSMKHALFLALLGAFSTQVCLEAASLRAGAARLEITPPVDAALPMSGYAARTEGFKKIRDPLYVRALVLADDSTTAAIVVWDLIGVPHAVADRLAERFQKELGIAPENLLVAGTHTHAAPQPQNASYMAWVQDRAIEAARQAKARLEPVRIGYGEGRANVNVNRVARTADGGWWLGVNPDGVSDKTVAVVKLETMAGVPLAILANYAVHGTVMGQRNYQISGDLPGAAARFVERHYQDRVVTLWTSGAAGDQNPIYGPGDEFSRVDALGMILGEEIVRVAEAIKTAEAGPMRGARSKVQCPGRRLAEGVKPRDPELRWVDADPVEIRLSVLRIGDIALAGVSGEVLTRIGMRLKKESPLRATLMITHANGSSGYIPDEESFQRTSYEITTSRLRPGCAEQAIVNGLVEMIRMR